MEAASRNVKAMQLLSSFVRQDSEDLNNIDSPSDAPNKTKSGQQISRPRDRQSFYERAHTYNPLWWFAKPLWLSPLECARWGWENVDVDVLRCVSCKAHMSGRTPAAHNPKTYDECSSRLTDSLRSGHCQACPWSSSPSPEYFLRLPYDTRPKAQHVFTQHFTRLLELKEQLPLQPESSLPDMGLELSQLEEVLGPYLGRSDEVSRPVAQSAALLSLTGWTTCRSAPGAGQVHCSLCDRRVGTWNFLTLANPCLGDLPGDITDSEDDVTPNSPAVLDTVHVPAPNGDRNGESVSSVLIGDGDCDGEIVAETGPASDQVADKMDVEHSIEGTESQNIDVKENDKESVLSASQSPRKGQLEDVKTDTTSALREESETENPESKPNLDQSASVDAESSTLSSKDVGDTESNSTAMETDDMAQSDTKSKMTTEKQQPGEESNCEESEIKTQQEKSVVTEKAKRSDSEENTKEEKHLPESGSTLTENITSDADSLVKEEITDAQNGSLPPETSDVRATEQQSQDVESQEEKSSSPARKQELKENKIEAKTEDESPMVGLDMEGGNVDNVENKTNGSNDQSPTHHSHSDSDVDIKDSDKLSNCSASGKDCDKHEIEGDTENEPPTKRQKTVKQPEPVRRKPKRQRALFQPLSEHHTWCPWVAGTESRVDRAGTEPEAAGSNDKAGWRQVLYLLMPQLSPNKGQSMRARASTGSPEVLRSIRRLFNEWTSHGVSR